MSESNALVPLADTMQLGKVLAASGFFADARGEAQAVVKVLAGRELGFGPVASMTGINIIAGRVALSANLMAAAVKRSGHYNYRVVELTDDVCRIDFFVKDHDRLGSSTFTKADALRAGTKNMDKFPRNMLFARAMSNGVRWYCPDVTGGPVYTPEELGANVNEEGEIVESSARVVEAAPAQAQPDNGHDADAQFASIPGAVEERDKTHWIDNDRVRARFWSWVTQHDLSKNDVHKALSVAHVQDYAGTIEEAHSALLAYYNQRVDAQATNPQPALVEA